MVRLRILNRLKATVEDLCRHMHTSDPELPGSAPLDAPTHY